jgi:D-cysteine desulfhydrase
VEDKYSCNGYEKFNDSIKKISDDSLMNYGFALDTTYTAKAYYGMREIVKQKSLKGIILFWYTGGIYNYLA